MEAILYTRKEFERLRLRYARKMINDVALFKQARNVLVKADRYWWIHQANWLGEPILRLPQDMFAVQEIIYNTRPDYIIELGIAWGGSLLFYSTLMKAIGGRQVIGVDIYIPTDLRKRLNAHGDISRRITLIRGSSIEKSTLKKIKRIIRNSQKVLVLLDSNHTHEHVLKELQLYSQFVGKGYYMVCDDTIVEDIPEQKHRPREWGKANSPKTAVQEFLKQNKNFKVDEKLENKLLLSCSPGGYLFHC